MHLSFGKRSSQESDRLTPLIQRILLQLNGVTLCGTDSPVHARGICVDSQQKFRVTMSKSSCGTELFQKIVECLIVHFGPSELAHSETCDSLFLAASTRPLARHLKNIS